jgi:NAD(P)-dependent dehydrogenase (short-subunit alcohol dehydrogenase family)
MEEPVDYSQLCLSLPDLRGQVAYVTGAGTGHGRACSKLMAAAGATIIAGHHQNFPLVQTLVQEIEAAGGRARCAALDVRSEQSVMQWFDFGASHGAPNILVNTTNNIGAVPFIETELDFWNRSHEINLRGVFICMREGLKAMLAAKRGGCIVNVTSIASARPVRYGHAAYSSAKAGVNMLTSVAAYEHTKDGIRANTLATGSIITEDVHTPDPAHRSDLPGVAPERSLMGRGSPQDVAAAALFLAGPGGRYINGQTLFVDGGYMVS